MSMRYILMYRGVVLDLQILGFLDDGPLHGYELRRRILELGGPGTRVSAGSLYPALSRLEAAGYLTREDAGSSRRVRRTLTITESGRSHLRQILRDTSGADLESQPRFLTVLAFLSRLPPEEQREVLRRRMEVLQTPPAFFYDDGRPRRQVTEEDPYRRGMITIASAARRAEITWLRQVLEDPGTTTAADPSAGRTTPPTDSSGTTGTGASGTNHPSGRRTRAATTQATRARSA